MRNPVTTQSVIEELTRLLTAFPRRGAQNIEQLAGIYKAGLVGIETEALRGAVTRCIQDDEFFPKVVRLRELANDWMKRNRAAFAPIIPESWDTCGICGARAQHRQITRFAITKPTSDSRTWYYQAGEHRIAYGDAAGIQRHLTLMPLETVTSTSTYMDHLPGPHNVHAESPETQSHP